MLEARQYQRDAIDALYSYWAKEGSGNGLIVLPTGAGKAYVIAKIIEELLRDYPGLRILNITHSKNLVSQNFKEFIGLMPFAPAGIYSAGLGRRDTNAQVLFCGIQSIWNKIDQIGQIDLIIVDEAHAISEDADTLYGKFFAAVHEQYPDSRTCGLTATDYRTKSGRLTEGEGKLFDDVVYEIGIGELIEQGFLSPLSTKSVNTVIDLKGVHTRGGEYVPGEVSNAADRIIVEGIAEDIARGGDRRAAMFFCVSQENAEKVCTEVRRHGKTCELLTSKNPGEHTRIIADFWSGKLWSIASVNMLTTGANYPFVDMISIYRSTRSPGLIVQIIGRVTRLCKGKIDGLVLDHGGNLSRFGPIDLISPKTQGKGDGEAPMKICPPDVADINGKFGCEELLHISIMECTCCHYIFPPSQEEKIAAVPDAAPVLSRGADMWRSVTSRRFAEHPGKEGKPNSVKVTFTCGFLNVNNWLCPGHAGFAKTKADHWWLDHGGQKPFPSNTEQFLLRQHELNDTAEIEIEYNGKWPNARSYRAAASNDNQRPADNDNAVSSEVYLDDDIPF